MEYTKFIPQNVAPQGARRIGVYNANGNRCGQIPLGTLTPPNPAKKLYSFGAVSDIHLQWEKLQKALKYLNETENVAFTCACGDLTNNGTTSELEAYKNAVKEYLLYAIAGNHDSTTPLEYNTLLPYTGQPLYYSFTQGDDVFIMVGEQAWSYTASFSTDELQWLYETLEANRNKRCFVFQHLLSFAGSGNPYPAVAPTTDILGSGANKSGKVFLALMQHYKNCIWFHGHSHTSFNCQEDNPQANYDKIYGIHSVHIPSLGIIRELNAAGTDYDEIENASEGYIVDVYEDGIHLRGRDFVKEEFLPIASYWLNTTLQTIPAGTFTDSTGTIKP